MPPTTRALAPTCQSTAASAPPCSCDSSDHFVQFYEQDAALVRSVGDFTVAQLKRGGRMIVIATAGHRDGIMEHLRAGGVDVDDAQADGSFIALDALETLGKFTREGSLDADRFDEVIGGLVTKCRRDGRELAAFGEMVALLWAEGKGAQAVQLEEFWNELKRKQRFTLYCAYPLGAFQTASASDAFATICGTHSRVFPSESYSTQQGLTDEQLRQIALLQQRAAALEAEVRVKRRREAELTAFVETATIGLHWVNADGIIIWANPAELQMLGYTSAEYVGHHISEFHADRPIIDDILSRLCRGERLRDYEARLRCKDGSIKTVMVDSSVLWDEGRFVHTQCFTRDVTDQRKAEETVRQQLADLRQLQELSWKVAGASDEAAMLHEMLDAALAVSRTDKGLLSLVVPDRNGIAVAASRGFAADFLRQIALVPGGSDACGSCFHSRDRVIVEDVREDSRFECYRDAAAQAGFRAVHSTPLITRDAKLVGVLSVHFATARRPTEREMRLLDLYARHAADSIDNARLRSELRRELDARTATAEELRITTDRFQLAAHGHTLTLFEQDSSLRYRWLYPAHPEHAGAIGRTDDEILGAEKAAAITTLKLEVLKTGLTRQAEVAAPLPTGTRYYDLTVSPKRNSRGEIEGVAGAAFDITPRKEAESALSHAKEETARINRELEHRVQERTASLTDLLSQMESFSYAVSHDLRSPLRAMAGFAEVLQQDHANNLSPEGRQLLERIIRASERMNRLIVDVLAYARVNRERMELTAVSLSQCLQHVVQHAPEFQPPQADVIVRGHLPDVLGNETFLTQVFANLLGNAVKFVTPGRKPRVEISAELREGMVRVTVADNGIGIAPEHRARLFGLFERLNVDKRYEGTGMGLAIVRRAIERMGGKIGVESDGTNGSRFLVDLPSAQCGVERLLNGESRRGGPIVQPSRN